MLTSFHLHMKSSEVCIKTRSTPASLPIQGQVTKQTTGDLTQPRRQRQRKRHLKIQVRVTLTTLRLFQFVQLLQCSRTIQ